MYSSLMILREQLHIRSSLIVLLFLVSTALKAQDDPMRVVHCKALPPSTEVINVHIDENNKKYAGTNLGLFEIHSADNASLIPVTDDLWSLAMQSGGNAHLLFARNELFSKDTLEGKILVPQNQVTAAYYDAQRQELWIGTDSSGVYCFSTKPQLALRTHFTPDNSKMTSPHVTSILVDRYQRQWIGTKEGIMAGKEGKWRLYEKKSNIQSITALGPDVWIMGDNILFMVDERNRWIPGDMTSTQADGPIQQMTYDSDGRLWVASNIISRNDVVNNKSERFGRGDGFKAKQVNSIITDKDNALWVGTGDQGLYLIEKEKTMTVSCEVVKALDCKGGQNDAVVQVNIIGGQPPYTYQWDKPGLSGARIENLSKGLYTVSVTDSSGLRKVVSAKVADIDLSISFTEVEKSSGPGQADGSVVAVINGGKPPYKWTWTNSSATALERNGLTEGEYSLAATDANGCQQKASVTIEALEGPGIEELAVQLTRKGNNLCAGDKNVSLEAIPKGGLGPYTYKWSDGASKSSKRQKLGKGTYEVTVVDSRGKSVAAGFAVDEGLALDVVARMVDMVSDEGRSDGQAAVKVAGGKPAYTISWDNGETGPKAVQLNDGTHTVSVTDANGCEIVKQVRIGTRLIPELQESAIAEGQIIKLEKLFFKADSANIEPVSLPSLNELVGFMSGHPDIIIEVGGHTNNIPPHEYCDRLSTARAKAVADYLVSKGVQGSRVRYRGYGKRNPIATNATAAGRRQNQRVEVKILSTSGSG